MLLQTLKPVGAGVLYGVFLGGHLLIMKAIGSNADPILLAWGFLASSNLFLALWLTAVKGWGKVKAGLPRWPQWVSVGVVNGIMTTLTQFGVNLSGASSAGVLVRSDLLFGLALGWLIYRERTALGELAGGALMLLGVWWVMDISFGEVGITSVGEVSLVFVGLLLAVNALVIKYGLRMVWGPAIAFFNTLAAGISLATVLLITGGWRQGSLLLEPAYFLGVMAVGLTEALALLAYYYALERFPVWIARSFGLVSPVVAFAGGWLLFSEVVGTRQVLGTLITMAGMTVMLVQRGKRGRTRKPKGQELTPGLVNG